MAERPTLDPIIWNRLPYIVRQITLEVGADLVGLNLCVQDDGTCRDPAGAGVVVFNAIRERGNIPDALLAATAASAEMATWTRPAQLTAEQYDWLCEHPKFQSPDGPALLHGGLDIQVVWVNPDTNEIDEDRAKNTAYRVWLEFGGWHEVPPSEGWPITGCWEHDIELDCSGRDLNEALYALYTLVRAKYPWNK